MLIDEDEPVCIFHQDIELIEDPDNPELLRSSFGGGNCLLRAVGVTDHGYGVRHDRWWRNKPSTSVSAIAKVSLKVGKFTMRS